ncbi:MAG: FAD-dependent oxidoreductase, partial [Candidatus Caenarcaniphilales bacterium]|nr:FAD-dependent oxidoreductase [Candidatus Caenarcaniphilales bacterium]
YWCAFKDEKLIKKKPGFFDTNWLHEYKTVEKENKESFFTPDSFITYGQVGPDLFMINWPKCGNDYSIGIERVFSKDPKEKQRFYEEARTYSLWFAKYIQDTLKDTPGGEKFGLAAEVFAPGEKNANIPGFAYIPYNREVRRVEGFETLTENELLPKLKEGEMARYLPESIAIGNYANDHHYFEMAKPGSEKYFKLAPKSIKWGGRYTGTPFSIPYKVLLPVKIDGLIVAEKSWSVSHIANGSTRLQPVCMSVGQAAGSAAAIAAKKDILPFNVSVKELQATLLNDPISPPALVSLYDVKPDNTYRAAIQRLILAGVIDFPKDGNFRPKELIEKTDLEAWLSKAKLTQEDFAEVALNELTRDKAAFLIESKANTFKVLPVDEDTSQKLPAYRAQKYCAKLKKIGDGESFKAEWIKDEKGKGITRVTPFTSGPANTAGLVTLDPEVYKSFQTVLDKEAKDFCFKGIYNHSGAWVLVTEFLP